MLVQNIYYLTHLVILLEVQILKIFILFHIDKVGRFKDQVCAGIATTTYLNFLLSSSGQTWPEWSAAIYI